MTVFKINVSKHLVWASNRVALCYLDTFDQVSYEIFIEKK